MVAPFYVADGKMPNSEMIKLMATNGIMLSCGWLPPSDWMASADIAALGALVEYGKFVELAHTLFAGKVCEPVPEFAWGT